MESIVTLTNIGDRTPIVPKVESQKRLSTSWQILAIVILASFTLSCGESDDIVIKVKLGMTIEEVTDILGEPDEIKFNRSGSTVVASRFLYDDGFSILFRDGIVVSFFFSRG